MIERKPVTRILTFDKNKRYKGPEPARYAHGLLFWREGEEAIADEALAETKADPRYVNARLWTPAEFKQAHPEEYRKAGFKD